MRVLVFILCMIASIASILQAFRMINQPSWLWNTAGAVVLFLIGYSISKTNFFTQFKKKK
jgi:membrane protein YdbS with pleckstrin-like domain